MAFLFKIAKLHLSVRDIGCVLLTIALCCTATHVDAAAPKAKLKISGYGLLGGLELKRTILLLENNGKKHATFDANFIEDAAVILLSRLTEDGYLHPEVTAIITSTNGQTVTFRWRQAFDEPLPRPFEATRVEFQIHKGLFYYYTSVRVAGLTTVPLKTARGYFVQNTPLLPLKRYKVYSSQRLSRSISSLSEAFDRQGYRDANIKPIISTNNQSGEVSVLVNVNEGPRSVVRLVRQDIIREDSTNAQVVVALIGKPYSPLWEQDFSQSIKTNLYQSGYPDTAVQISTVYAQTNNNIINYDLAAKVTAGPKIKLGAVKYEGRKKTKVDVLSQRTELTPGQLLDRIRVERARYRISSLGIFDAVGLRYDNVDAHTRDAVFELKEGKELEASMLFGFGTYELLRVGFDIEQHNIWGRAHNARFRITQSFKTTSADYLYTIPQVVGEDVNAFFTASALHRQEIDFLREEYGGGVGLQKLFRPISLDVSGRFNYQLVTASQTDVDPSVGLRSAQVSGFIFDLKHDKRDNPLYPHRGYKIFGNVEVATDLLGGEVNYERFEVSGSYHFAIGEGRWLHFGADHGAVFTDRGPALDLPFNKRFFPGGENSIRGYTEGEASPRNPGGTLLGAESFLLGSVEVEQSLTPKLSLVGFVDSLGIARDIKDYPFHQVLTSVGGGLNYGTLIGPVRLEYGHNLNPRPRDPAGTIQFSVGFPF
ncbi:MAG: surface antigen [Verrucomicrobiales bacterium]|nr:surface antigen [Verrucomicrobiales bacterium]